MPSALAIAIEQLPFLTRAQALEEGEHDPRFWSYLLDIMHHPNPAVAVDTEMKKAAMNALNPSEYREEGNRWPMFRRKIVEAHNTIAGHLRAGRLPGLEGIIGMADIPGIVTSLDTPTAQPAAQPSGGSDIWSTLGKAFTAIAPAVGGIFSSKIAASAQKSVAGTAAGVANAQLAAQQAAAQQAALAAKGGGSSIIMYVLLGLLGVGGLIALMHALKG
jgi:hypothetical protein